jgi:hypothetical protein
MVVPDTVTLRFQSPGVSALRTICHDISPKFAAGGQRVQAACETFVTIFANDQSEIPDLWTQRIMTSRTPDEPIDRISIYAIAGINDCPKSEAA